MNLFTDVSEQPGHRPVTVYPVPADNWLVIDCDPSDFREAVLYSIEGKICRRQKVMGYTQRMELSGMEGVFLLELVGPAGTMTKRIVVSPR